MQRREISLDGSCQKKRLSDNTCENREGKREKTIVRCFIITSGILDSSPVVRLHSHCCVSRQ